MYLCVRYEVNLSEPRYIRSSFRLILFIKTVSLHHALHTVGPAYNDFGYNEPSAITSKFLCTIIIHSNAKKFSYNGHQSTMSSFFYMFLLVLSGTQCTFTVHWYLAKRRISERKFGNVQISFCKPLHISPIQCSWENKLFALCIMWSGEYTCYYVSLFCCSNSNYFKY